MLSVYEVLAGFALPLLELLVWLKPFYGSDRDHGGTGYGVFGRSSTKQDEAEGDFY